jgi:hypothetical protein
VLGGAALTSENRRKALYVLRIQPVCFAYVICTYTATLGGSLTNPEWGSW